MIRTFENNVPFSDANGSGRQKAVLINISSLGNFDAIGVQCVLTEDLFFALVLCFHYCKIDDCCCFICKKVYIVNSSILTFFRTSLCSFFAPRKPMSKHFGWW